jgi:hypothetical protein
VTSHITQGEMSVRATSAAGMTGRDAKVEVPVTDAAEVLDDAEIPRQPEV